jgi:hypothetical protein
LRKSGGEVRRLPFAITDLLLPLARSEQPGLTIHVTTPMAATAWALLERELLRYNSIAVERFANYLDERGYLLHTARWGTLAARRFATRGHSSHHH